jgi:hypothetical protein
MTVTWKCKRGSLELWIGDRSESSDRKQHPWTVVVYNAVGREMNRTGDEEATSFKAHIAAHQAAEVEADTHRLDL